MPLPSQMLLGLVLLPTVGVLLHIFHCSTYNALFAGGHLQLPVSNLTGVEDCHPSHHEVPGAHRLLL